MLNFVTGASGFLGGRLTQMLLAQGEQVILLARPSADLRHLPQNQLQIVRGDLGDPGALIAAVREADRIFHCAACSTDWAPDATYQAANVLGTDNLVAAAVQAPRLQRFVHVSTTDIYGYPESPCAEDSPAVNAGLPYNRTKILAESIVWQARADHGLPITILRPATIYGPRGKDFTQEIATLLRQRLMATIDRGKAPGGFVYIDTVAQALLDASSSPATEGKAYNLADPAAHTWAHYLQLFAGQLGSPAPWINFSFRNALRFARMLEKPHRLLHLAGRPLLTQHAVYLLGRNQNFPVTRAHQDFLFTPTISLEEGICRSIAWLRDRDAPKR